MRDWRACAQGAGALEGEDRSSDGRPRGEGETDEHRDDPSSCGAGSDALPLAGGLPTSRSLAARSATVGRRCRWRARRRHRARSLFALVRGLPPPARAAGCRRRAHRRGVVRAGPPSSATSPTVASSGRSPRSSRAAPARLIALAALGGLILIADGRTRFGLAQRGLTPWQRLPGPRTPAPAPWRRARWTCTGGPGSRSSAVGFIGPAAAGAWSPSPCCRAGRRRGGHHRHAPAHRGVGPLGPRALSAHRGAEDEHHRVAAPPARLRAADARARQRCARPRCGRPPRAPPGARAARVDGGRGRARLGDPGRRVARRSPKCRTIMMRGGVDDPRRRALDRGPRRSPPRRGRRCATPHPRPGSPIYVFAQAAPDGAEVFVRDEGRAARSATVRPSAAACATRSSAGWRGRAARGGRLGAG